MAVSRRIWQTKFYRQARAVAPPSFFRSLTLFFEKNRQVKYCDTAFIPMSDIFRGLDRGGIRGGKDQFKWDDVKTGASS